MSSSAASSSSAPAPAPAFEVDPSIWHAVVGAAVRIPELDSYVYYFPEGHLEHFSCLSSVAINCYNFPLRRPFIPCQVLSIDFLSNPLSDQAFVKILLQPLQPLGPRPVNNDDKEDEEEGEGDVVSFSKVLTPSDANNGGGFSVPRFCADIIFPRLDFAADPPVQNLTLMDTHGNAWEFRHIYRGTPRRHLLTTGWSKFINAKHLVAGDSVVFIRKRSTNELFVGVKRAQRFGGGGHEVNRRNCREVLEAIENAAKGIPFEVVYYPRVGFPDFVVKAEKVKEAMKKNWIPGLRVRIAVETDDSSRMTWFQGTIAAALPPSTGPWIGSLWRMLQVNWDEPESVQNLSRVNPWQVEYVHPLQDSSFPPHKKLRVMPGGSDQRPIELAQTVLGQLTPADHNASPGGIQGARPVHTSTYGPSTYNGHWFIPWNVREPETVSTTLTIGSSSHSRSLSPAAQSSSGSTSFQLFGQTIQMASPPSEQKPSSQGSCSHQRFSRPPDESWSREKQHEPEL